eukprot:CAMPEP_0116842534 /NCGR_PEP_ID=MMETSP0418-20121206/11573_1 /TAXON_ID=1158023 /ORGANISM="Astrosyne radiata, Strain 13vi08-1A" /LENGTH=222 /DNA_ID=CAMNT_0004473161 /DNA_START=193 /DNA_END=861 /DNA_ORIENTATION=+
MSTFFVCMRAFFAVKDVKEAVKSTVEEKMMERKRPLVPKRLKERVIKRVAKLASDFMTASKMAGKIAEKMTAEMPQKMMKKGLTVHVEEVFREGPYFVLQLQVLKVDAVVMAEAAKMKDEEEEEEDPLFVRCVKQFMEAVGGKNKDRLESRYLPTIVQNKMHSGMGDMLAKELSEKKMEAEAEVLPEAKQARFLFAMLKQVKEAETAEKAKKGPLAAIKKKK